MPGHCILQQQDSVQVIGHNHEFIQRDVRNVLRNIVPTRRHHGTDLVQAHLVRHDLTEQTFSIYRTERDKVRPDSRIVVTCDAHVLTFQKHAHANWSPPCRILLRPTRQKVIPGLSTTCSYLRRARCDQTLKPASRLTADLTDPTITARPAAKLRAGDVRKSASEFRPNTTPPLYRCASGASRQPRSRRTGIFDPAHSA